MPEKETIKRAAEDKREGKAPTTQAGEFIREEMEHIRRGEHGARSPKQAIAIGLSKARKAGVKLPPPGAGKAQPKTRESARRDYEKGQSGGEEKTSPKRSRGVRAALKRERQEAASRKSLSRQGQSAASRRSSSERSRAAKKAARTKGPGKRQTAAQKGARTRARHAE